MYMGWARIWHLEDGVFIGFWFGLAWFDFFDIPLFVLLLYRSGWTGPLFWVFLCILSSFGLFLTVGIVYFGLDIFFPGKYSLDHAHSSFTLFFRRSWIGILGLLCQWW